MVPFIAGRWSIHSAWLSRLASSPLCWLNAPGYAILNRGGYVRFGADGLTAALGYYMMTAAQLDRHRQAVNRETHDTRLAELVERLRDGAA